MKTHHTTFTVQIALADSNHIGELAEGHLVFKAGRSMVFVRGIISNASAGGEPMASFSSVLKKTKRS